MTESISDLYKKFSKAEGCQHIASEYAIKMLWSIKQRFRTNKILEVGLGIGSISGTLLTLSKDQENLQYSGTETNSFCLASLSQNFAYKFPNLTIYPALANIPNNKKFDLIIVDGTDQQLEKINELCLKNAIIAIEGDRNPQQEILRKLFPKHKYVHLVSTVKNKSYSPFPSENWQGGLKVIFTDPTTKQLAWWTKEKILNKVKYWYRWSYS